MRRKGEKRIPRLLDRWSPEHPVAHAIATGSSWFTAWQMQKCIPIAKLAKQIGIAAERLTAIGHGDHLARTELDALARAWTISAGDLIASMPDPSLVLD